MQLALVGIGKIARDQHVPALSSSEDFELVATVSLAGVVDGVPGYGSVEAMLAAHPQVEVVSLSLPPVPRFAVAAAALKAGRHVMLEKPPGATFSEVVVLDGMARAAGVTLFATWHSRRTAGVAAAKAWLSGRVVTGGRIDWREDVRHWHPGQDWVFEPGGMGVFDPGINALAILTEILPGPLHVVSAELEVPENRQTPIAAEIAFSGGITAGFDWRGIGPPVWDIVLEVEGGARMALRRGGRVFEVDGVAVPCGEVAAYPALYAAMAGLVRAGRSEVDLAPLMLVADAMMLGRRGTVEAFEF